MAHLFTPLPHNKAFSHQVCPVHTYFTGNKQKLATYFQGKLHARQTSTSQNIPPKKTKTIMRKRKPNHGKSKNINLRPPQKEYSIKKIFTRNLFGTYDYDIQSEQEDLPSNHPQLLIIYGDNGSGKTTLLKLVLHLLSPVRNRGHRSFIAKVKFERFGVEIENGITVEAYRPTGQTTGDFRIRFSQDNIPLAEAEFNVDSDGDVLNDDAAAHRLYAHLTALDVEFHYLADDRRLERSDAVDDADLLASPTNDDTLRAFLERRQKNLHLGGENTLIAAIDNVVEWFRKHALMGADSGTVQANTIYSDVIKRIADHGGDEGTSASTIEDLQTTLSSISRRNETFSKFGLSPPLDVSDIQNTILSARKGNQRLIRSVLQPYLDGVVARLDALQDLVNIVERFTGSLGSFYRDKIVSLDLQNGLTITSLPRNERLRPQDLSSGEKQLLLLLCNILSARDRASVFIIDEPEISLNIKWQRKLVSALLGCMENSSSQLIIATHSVELLAQYKNNISKLTNISDLQHG
ncbi:hypothetical protein D7Y23_37685 [Corallococcus sp. AB050B]|nr:hypothetical protein D7Y23_37685 [Corallococcus sp. AB050B]